MARIPTTDTQRDVLEVDPMTSSRSDSARHRRSNGKTSHGSCCVRSPYRVLPHVEIETTHKLTIVTGQTGDGESQEAGDRAEPAYRGSDMRGEREFAEAGCNGHYYCAPRSVTLEGGM